jgi:protocatechuate 4,5-dioxygenase beta chain
LAEIIWGLATSHVPSIGAAHDHGRRDDPAWKPLFDGYAPAQEWMAEHRPDVAIVVYNDHANAVSFDVIPTFGIGTASRFPVADEGWGPRNVPEVVGHPALARHLAISLVDAGFDMTVFSRLEVDHGLTVPMSVYCPDPGDAWPCPVVPVLVNVIQYPQPLASRCLELGRAIGRAVEQYPEDLKVAIFGTGGMSHQLAGKRAGLINEKFDREFLEKIETDPEALGRLSREELVEKAGTEGIELIMWLVMRGAMTGDIHRIHDTYFVPASNTAAALALFATDAKVATLAHR